MPIHKKLWLLKFSAPASSAEVIGEALDEGAVAVTVLSPPRKKTAQIEVLYDHKPEAPLLAAKLAVLAATLEIPSPRYTLRRAPKLDWLKKVAGDFPPLKIARWTVHGAQHRKRVPDRRYALQIDAESAFGTGEHPTTRGCLLMLDKILKTNFSPCRMADIGCGSGILAMAFAQATGGRAIAVDSDPESARIAAENVRINGLSKKIRFIRGNGYAAALLKKAAPYDLIMANIFADPLCEMAKDLKKNLSPKGRAILSGILKSQANKVILEHRKQGLSLVDRKILGEWAILILKHSGLHRYVRRARKVGLAGKMRHI